tara:strand:- start:162 stop:368 length:207 start_codon:yes stop_codon:yes gene_type:complete
MGVKVFLESPEEEEHCVTIVFNEADPEEESEKTYSFNTENELKAFLTGVNETEGKTIHMWRDSTGKWR